MIIEEVKRETKKVNFENLKVGDCYLDSEDILCMKIDTLFSESGNKYNCVYLEDGDIGSDWGEVTLVEATIQYYIKQKE
jgi:hypothetical protein